MPDWQEILTRDGPPAWRTAYRLLGNRADADECFQETCLAALAVSRREAVQNWRGLLQRLAAARAVDLLRARRRTVARTSPIDCGQVRDDGHSPLQGAAEAELAEEIRLALGRIPRQQAEVFCLHCVEDWSYQDIARRLGISISSVGVLIHRARQRLRGLLTAFDQRAQAADAVPSTLPASAAPPAASRKELP
jgi:RNA polymerase sigma-70 factor (ECF subfamily)